MRAQHTPGPWLYPDFLSGMRGYADYLEAVVEEMDDTEDASILRSLIACVKAIKPVNILFDSQLRELCDALGWQGGTFHQALAQVKMMVAERAS